MVIELAEKTLASLILRLALAAIFIFHGWGKVRTEGNEWGANWAKAPAGQEPMAKPLQLAVAWGELVGGIALAIGFLSRLAALGIAVIMAGAIYTVHWKNGFGLFSNGTFAGGYEYTFALLAMCLAVLILGSGALSLDAMLFRRRVAAARWDDKGERRGFLE